MAIAPTLTAEAGVKRIDILVLVVVAGVAAGGCETSSTVSAGPTPVKCQVSLGSTAMMDAGGGTGSFAVTTQPECAWDV